MLSRFVSIVSIFATWQQSVRTQTPPNVALSDLAMYLPFDDNYQDYSGNNNHGIGTNTRFFPGKVNQALFCNGNAYVQGAADKLPTTERTVAFWFYAFSINEPALFSYGGGTPIGNAPNSWLQSINGGGTVGTNYNYYILLAHEGPAIKLHYSNATGTPAPILCWHHWAATTDATGTCLYIDGKKETCDTSLLFNATNVAGKHYSVCTLVSLAGVAPFTTTGWAYFSGMIDELLVYRKALTEAQIQQLYQPSAPTPLPTTTQSSTTIITSKIADITSSTSTRSSTSISPTSSTIASTTTSQSSTTDQASVVDKEANPDIAGYAGAGVGGIVVGALVTAGIFTIYNCQKDKKAAPKAAGGNNAPSEIIYESLGKVEPYQSTGLTFKD